MALRELVNETELKSLKYGFDAFGGGASGQPYIVTDINTQKVILPNNITTTNLLGKDAGFIRGGFEGAAKASIIDTVRVGKWLLDNPLWIAKQVGLQLSNPKLEVKTGVASLFTSLLSGNLGPLTGGLLGPTRLYNLGVNTIAQIPVNAFGVHFNRNGLLPVMIDQDKYEAVVKYNNEDTLSGSSNNRLVKLRKKLEIADPLELYKEEKTTSLLANSNLAVGEGADLIDTITNFISVKNFSTDLNTPIDDYLTGPDSVYGIGKTLIRRFQNTNDAISQINVALYDSNQYATANTRVNDFESFTLGQNRYLSGITDKINNDVQSSSIELQVDKNRKLSLNDYNVIDYIPTFDSNGIPKALKTYSQLFEATNKVTTIAQSMSFSDAKNYESSNYFGVPKHPFSKDRKIFTTIAPNTTVPNRGASDFKYYGNKTVGDQGSVAIYDNTYLFDRYDSDILTIMFRAVDPFTLNEERFAFSAYISDYRDTFDATWTDINYIGRSEPFYIYSKFKRSVSFNLKIPCFNRTQLFEKHRALGQLASTTAGTYDNRSGKTNALGGVLIRLNVGNYLVGEYATMNSLNYSIPNDATWDITPEARLAMYIDASFQFNIIHQTLPQYEPSATDEGNSRPVGFFGYLPDTEIGDKEFIKIPGRDNTQRRDRGQQNKVTNGFTIDLVDSIKNANGDSLSKGTKLDTTNPRPIAGNSSRLVNPE